MGRSGRDYKDRTLQRRNDRQRKFGETVRDVQPRREACNQNQSRQVERDVADGGWHDDRRSY